MHGHKVGQEEQAWFDIQTPGSTGKSVGSTMTSGDDILPAYSANNPPMSPPGEWFSKTPTLSDGFLPRAGMACIDMERLLL